MIFFQLVGDIEFVYGIQRTMELQSESSSAPIYAYKMTLESPLNYFKRFCLVKYFKTLILSNFVSKMSGNNFMKSLCEVIANKLPTNPVPGVAHGDDLFYLFTNFFTAKIIKGSVEDRHIQKFLKLWTNFAKYGNPTPEIDESLNGTIWKPISKGEVDAYFIIDEKDYMKRNEEKGRVDFWKEIYDKYSS